MPSVVVSQYGSPLGTCRLSCCRTSSLVLSRCRLCVVALSPLVVSCCRPPAAVLSPSWCRLVAPRSIVLSPSCCRIVAVDFSSVQLPCMMRVHTIKSVASINSLFKPYSLKCSVGLYYNCMSGYASMSDFSSYLFIYLFIYLLLVCFS